jgi:tetratricopeptide (TPR) repeat protein
VRRAALVAAALACGQLVGLHATAARADGIGVWARAADPDAERAERLRRAVEELLVEAHERGERSTSGKERLRIARNMLVAFGAATRGDVRLRFAFGRVLGLLGDDAQAVGVYESALAEAPDAPGAAEAWFGLAVGYARLRRPADEVVAYGECLRRETDPRGRATALANRAESEVLQGRLEAALADYDAALALEPDSPTTHWSRAVALDRAGDPLRALAEARVAILLDPGDTNLFGDNVFFVPAYDRHWYEALGGMVRAAAADAPEARAYWLSQAIDGWKTYLAAATPDDRWAPIARARLAATEKELRELLKRIPPGRRPRPAAE